MLLSCVSLVLARDLEVQVDTKQAERAGIDVPSFEAEFSEAVEDKLHLLDQ
ncbi:MAG TPA: hypothetical protein QGF58_11810 [Myxococcota bacterium]|nr:hypothetical protein [Myxococcota bacterium]